MEAFKSYNQVVEQLRELIADALDVNRRHIDIISIRKGERIGRLDYSIEYHIVYMNDGAEHNAIWTVSHWSNGDSTENIKVN